MAFFGIYQSSYLGGPPFLLSSPFRLGMYGIGMHPSSYPAPNINYITGRPIQGNFYSVPMAQTMAYNNIQAAPNIQAPLGVPVQNPQNQENLSFQRNDIYQPQTEQAKLLNMPFVLETAKNQQGFIGKAVDGIKGFTGIGLSSKKCQKYIDAANSGQMSIEEAYNKVSKYASSQRSGVNLVTSALAGGLALLALKGRGGEVGLKTALTAMGIGASVKAGTKALDRGTNNIQDDALNIKNISKDAISGALNGVTTYTVTGIGGIENIKNAANFAKGAMYAGSMGAVSGAIMGATDYTADAAFEKDEKFSVGSMLKNSLNSAIVLGSAGVLIGGIKGSKNYKKAHPVNQDSNSVKTNSNNDKAQTTVNGNSDSGQPAGQNQPEVNQNSDSVKPNSNNNEAQTSVNQDSNSVKTNSNNNKAQTTVNGNSDSGQPAGQNQPEVNQNSDSVKPNSNNNGAQDPASKNPNPEQKITTDDIKDNKPGETITSTIKNTNSNNSNSGEIVPPSSESKYVPNPNAECFIPPQEEFTPSSEPYVSTVSNTGKNEFSAIKPVDTNPIPANNTPIVQTGDKVEEFSNSANSKKIKPDTKNHQEKIENKPDKNKNFVDNTGKLIQKGRGVFNGLFQKK